ncbi:MAG: nitroreductase family protein [Armatimonadetes bacterium]|nr:nitroreductase family protein [Armatimonadota bacterium]
MSRPDVSQAALLETLLTRRSVRQFKADPIPVEWLQQVMQAAQAAPYGTVNDEREFVVLGGEAKDEFVAFVAEGLDAILPVLGDAPAKTVLQDARGLIQTTGQAPVIVAVFKLVSDEGHTLALSSAAAAVENLLLAAWSLGLGGCFTTGGVYLGDSIAEYLNLPGRQLIALVPLGHPLRVPPVKPRPDDAVIWRGFAEIIGREQARALPLDDEQQMDAQVDAAAARLTVAEPWKVLIVDVATQATERTARVLRRAGYAVQQCARPSQALTAIATHQPDVVILDALLPEMSGYDLCRQIRQDITGYLPVIVTTTAQDAADIAIGIVSGADEVLLKPVSRYELLAALQALLRSKALYAKLEVQTAELQAAYARLRELEGLRDDLTHMIVHDLRTPLTNVIGNLQSLEEADYDRALTQEFVPVAVEAGQTLLGMVNDLLDISKLEAGKMTLEITEFAVAEVVEAALGSVRGLAEQKRLALSSEVAPPNLRLRADEDKIRRALTNMLGNAVKYTQEGSVRVQARAEEGGVLIAVTDTGEGIPEADRDRVFEKFGQVEMRSAGRKMSTGLGLAFVRLAIEAHGGKAWVESELGKGTTLCISLPAP